jgi:hypothetical protein
MSTRDVLKYTHLIAGGVLSVVVYSPLIDNGAALWFTRLVTVPFLVLGGVWMFIQSRRWAAEARAVGAAPAQEG